MNDEKMECKWRRVQGCFENSGEFLVVQVGHILEIEVLILFVKGAFLVSNCEF